LWGFFRGPSRHPFRPKTFGVITILRDLSMSTPEPANVNALQARLSALEIDLRSALAISSALLQGLTATSRKTHHAIDLALDEALRAIATEERHGSAAVHAIVSETREKLRAETGIQERMARDLERLIIDKASAIQGDGGGVVIARDFTARRPRPPGASPV
jgi:hypothetical protein